MKHSCLPPFERNSKTEKKPPDNWEQVNNEIKIGRDFTHSTPIYTLKNTVYK